MMNSNDIFSCSTSWNADRHANGREMIEEIKSLGFKVGAQYYAKRILDFIDPETNKKVETYVVFDGVFRNWYNTKQAVSENFKGMRYINDGRTQKELDKAYINRKQTEALYYGD
jgi:hypothetical protein